MSMELPPEFTPAFTPTPMGVRVDTKVLGALLCELLDATLEPLSTPNPIQLLTNSLERCGRSADAMVCNNIIFSLAELMIKFPHSRPVSDTDVLKPASRTLSPLAPQPFWCSTSTPVRRSPAAFTPSHSERRLLTEP